MPLSGIHKLLRKGGALVDGARATGSTRLKEGAELALALPEKDAAALRERMAAAERKPASPTNHSRIPVCHRDEHVLAFDKPAGVAAHPGSGHQLEDTALGALYALLGRGTATFTPALVGRLDRDTSGVQLAGVSPQGLRGLSELSRERRIAKVYLAIVRGNDMQSSGRIDAGLVDTKHGRARMRALVPGENVDAALDAVTEYSVISRGRGACLVEVRPQTGRRHQIRAHFKSIGSPLAGDVRYGDAKWNRELSSRAKLTRLFLHCAETSFTHPVTGLEMRIRSPLPKELEHTLRLLGVSL
jgi:23S rRNA pseudouridine955/2504/2580 synthase